MAIIGKTEIKANDSINATAETRLLDLFSFSERSKSFPIDQDVKRGETNLTVKIEKLGDINFMSNANLLKGYNTSLAGLLNWEDTNKLIKAQESIQKDEVLTVTVEN